MAEMAEQDRSLDQLRVQIDQVDTALLELLNRRADLVHEVGIVKKAEGSSIYVPEREEALLLSLEKKNKGRLPPSSVRAIYREIMSASLALEKDLVIGYLGPQATWTHQAARAKFGSSVRYEAQQNISDVFDRVARRFADYGVVPIENSVEGAVNHTLDMFIDSELRICAQILLRIENSLLSNVSIREIKKIYSHPQVFGQCRRFIEASLRGVELIEVSSTTRAAELASKDPSSGSLSSAAAAEVYDLKILERAVQDNPNNTTRFLVISHATSTQTGNDRTSLVFTTVDRAGALYSALGVFNDLKINLTQLESRPSKRKNWEYFFFVDLDGHFKDPMIEKALTELQSHCTYLKVLGSYPMTESIDPVRALGSV
jgi:chorismate mutase/prephenate dehydratase